MDTKGKYVDLHIHSSCSDGGCSPKEIIDVALENNTNIISITDHDSIKGLTEFKENIKENMIGVKGVEYSSYIIIDGKRLKIHLLGYGFDENNEVFSSLINEMRDKRVNSHMHIINEVNENVLALPDKSIEKLDIEKYSWFDREIINQLKEDKFDSNKIEEIQRFFNQRKYNYSQDYYLDAKRAIDAIHSANGYAVFAHPMDYGFDYETISKIIIKLSEYGIDGLEAYQSECTRKDSKMLINVANELGLLYSAGSDFHKFGLDGRIIGKGIDSSLCINETTLSNRLIKEKKCFRKGDMNNDFNRI